MSKRIPARAGQTVTDPANWTGTQLGQRDDWLIALTDKQISDLTDLARRVAKQIDDEPNNLLQLSRDQLSSDATRSIFEGVYQLLKNGPGIALIRGLPVDSLRPIEAAIIYWAIGKHFGQITANNPQGDMLGHVVNLGKDMNDPLHRAYQTKSAIDFHNDQCDAVGLLCRQTSKSGGLSKVVSSVAVYNAMLEKHPDAVRILSESFYWTMHGEIMPGQDNFYQSPVFNFVDGFLCTSFGPVHIRKGHQLDGVPDITDEQLEAISLAEHMCEALHYSMELQRGDMQFLNNSVVLHTRTGFEDWPELEKRRHLWRLWLTIPDIRPASPYQVHWRKERGIPIPIEKQRVVLGGFD
jgi:hypothetical protein